MTFVVLFKTTVLISITQGYIELASASFWFGCCKHTKVPTICENKEMLVLADAPLSFHDVIV
uniref:Uncharacterized protein n=1 Tax=Triticum urartu TaxID=4572 RepID=A0A8R7V246_TRIUA